LSFVLLILKSAALKNILGGSSGVAPYTSNDVKIFTGIFLKLGGAFAPVVGYILIKYS